MTRVVTPSYSVHLGTQLGERKRNLRAFESLDITLRTNGPHVAHIIVPTVVKNKRFPYDLLVEDAWLEIWRGVNEYPKSILADTVFLLQEFKLFYSGDAEKFKIDASSGSVLAEWPIVAYDAASAEADKTDFADDMILEIARENMGADAADRDMSSLLTIPSNQSLGASISKAFSRRELARVFTDLCNASAQNGQRLYWDVVLDNPGNFNTRKLRLIVVPDQRGAYKGFDTVNPLVFSTKKGNLRGAELTKSYRGVVNYAHGLGNGLEENRKVYPASDTNRIASSPWGRIKEGTIQVDSEDESVITNEAEGLLREKRPRWVFTAEIVQTPDRLFGVHWNHGDVVGIEEFGLRFEAMISPVSIGYRAGKEIIRASIRAEI